MSVNAIAAWTNSVYEELLKRRGIHELTAQLPELLSCFHEAEQLANQFYQSGLTPTEAVNHSVSKP